MGETRVGEAWGEQYSAGMSSKEAAAFKRGWDAAINMFADHFDTPRIVWFGSTGVTVFDNVEHAEEGLPRPKDLTVWMREQLSTNVMLPEGRSVFPKVDPDVDDVVLREIDCE